MEPNQLDYGRKAIAQLLGRKLIGAEDASRALAELSVGELTPATQEALQRFAIVAGAEEEYEQVFGIGRQLPETRTSLDAVIAGLC